MRRAVSSGDSALVVEGTKQGIGLASKYSMQAIVYKKYQQIIKIHHCLLYSWIVIIHKYPCMVSPCKSFGHKVLGTVPSSMYTVDLA